MVASDTTPKKLIDDKNYNTYILFLYNLAHLPTKDKVRFYYGLKGRDGKSGIINQLQIQQLARGALLVEQKKASLVEAFLRDWRCSFDTKEVLIRNE